MLKKLGLCSALFILVGCTTPIPEGDIKNFVDNIDYDKTFNEIDKGKSIIESILYQDEDTILGSVKIITEFEKNDELKTYYYYCYTEVSGNYHLDNGGQYNFYTEEKLAYNDENGNVYGYKKTDNEFNDFTQNSETLYGLVCNFFYLEVTSGYHEGNVYYGDYIIANCGKYYECFSLNEDKDILTYKINVEGKDTNDDVILTMHDFSVNKYGMILNLSTKSMYYHKDEFATTTIEANYDNQIIRKDSL